MVVYSHLFACIPLLFVWLFCLTEASDAVVESGRNEDNKRRELSLVLQSDFNATEYADQLITVIEHGDSSTLQDMVFSGIDVNVESSADVVPLLMAAYIADIACIRILVEANADLEVTEGDGWTALMFVAHAGSFEATKYLIEQGADPFSANHDEFTAYEIAHASGYIKVAQYLANAELRVGLDRENSEEVWIGLEHGAMRELTNRDGYTALLYFCSIGDFDAIAHLTRVRRADYLVRERDGWDCLMFSAYHGDVDTLALLLQFRLINEHDSVSVARAIALAHQQYQALALLDDYIADNGLNTGTNT